MSGFGDQKSTHGQSSRLLQLPAELQLSIWEFTLAESDPIPFFTKDISGVTDQTERQSSDRLRWYIPPLLQTCHSCRMEGTPIFYTSNMFILQHEPIFDSYQQAHIMFRRYWQYLLLIKEFGIEYKLPSSNTFLLRGRRRLTELGYIFVFSSDAAKSHQRPLTALEASETDNCLCMIESMIKKRKYSNVDGFTAAMVAFLASFGEKMSKNELRVLRLCNGCGKKMVEQKPRWRSWEVPPPISMPMQNSMESIDD